MITIDIRKSEHTIEEYSIFVSFPYDADIIDVIREQYTRFWDNVTKEWELPLSSLETLVDRLHNYEITINADENIFLTEEVKIPSGFKYKTKPFKHQEDCMIYGLKHNRWILGDEQGLGKTKEVIDLAIAKKIQYGYKHCLILCCVNGLKWNWKEEIAIHSNESGFILGERVNRKGRLVIDGNKEKYGHLCNLPDDYFIITNIESLRDAHILNKLVELCETRQIEMIAIDEMHLRLSPASQQGKSVLKLQAETMIAMSGTPLMNSPLDLYTPLKWIGAETHTFNGFRQHYCEFGGYGDYEVVGYQNLEDLQKLLESVMLRRRKSEVLDLPEKLYVKEYVEMTPKQAQIYKEVHSDICAHIDQIKMSNNPLAEMIRLRQATGYTGILSSMIQESAKLDRMEEIVEESVANGKQIVIFSNWTQITNVVEERLSKYRVCTITGEVDDSYRQLIKNDFQAGKYDVLVGSTGAMGTGLTLTAATVEIFMDEPWNRAKKEQAEDRCHRTGTTENVTIYTLLTKGTIDERIHEIVYEKGEVADFLVDGEIKDKGALVDYLLS